MQHQDRLVALHRKAPIWSGQSDFGEELDAMERVVRDLRRRALDVRTTAVRRVLERIPRVAAELARSLEKRVEVTISGDEVEVDRAVLDHIDDALLHLVRNAVDHGIESPAEREQAGKDPIGSICLEATQAAGRLQLRLIDDGAGIDVERVRARAVESGMLPEAVAEDLPAERVIEYLFEPGLSTKDEVSEVSGRGVGMDAVKRQLESLGGQISVTSIPGAGTTMEIDLPSMVALQRVLIAEVQGGRVALPVGSVQAVVALEAGEVEGVGGDAFFVWKDEPLPLIDLNARMGLGTVEDQRGSVVVLDAQGFRLGVRVERVAASHEVMVREAPDILSAIKPISGVALLADGEPVFLLEPGPLVEEFF